MKRLASHLLVLLFAMQAVVLFAQEHEKIQPGFTLSIAEDKGAARIDPGLHRLQVKFTRLSPEVEYSFFHEEAKGMYEMIVLRDGVPAAETDAMRELRRLREADDNPWIPKPVTLDTGESRTTPLDVSDYYEMTKPGRYQITVTRGTAPFDPPYNITVKSNTITIVVPRGSARSAAPAAEKPKPKFDLFISEVYPDQWPPVVIRVKLNNISDSVIRECGCASFLGMYNLFVFRDGDPVEANDQMRDLEKRRAAAECSLREYLSEIEPGDSTEEEIPVGNFYDVSRPGSYVVYATRETYPYNLAKSVVVESSAISFNVPEPPPEPKANEPEPETDEPQ